LQSRLLHLSSRFSKAYLRSLPPIKNQVPLPVPPGAEK
jgi:hypothetical protein